MRPAKESTRMPGRTSCWRADDFPETRYHPTRSTRMTRMERYRVESTTMLKACCGERSVLATAVGAD